MQLRRKNVVVCGASMAGLFAARVLSDFYETVTVVERDLLPETAAQRRGVAQGRHLHMMLSPGSSYSDELFPGLLDELGAAGAHVPDPTDPSPFYLRFGDHELCRTGEFTSPDQIVILLASRPFLEHHVRRRVRRLANVTFLEGHDVVEPVVEPPDRVSAVRIVDRATGAPRVLETDLVVDATGRSARTPAFLEAHGYDRPADQKYTVNLTYSSQFFRIPIGALADEKIAVVSPTLRRPTGVGLLAYEDDTAILTLIGVAGHELPTDLTGVLAGAAELLPARVMDALRAAEPLGDVSAQRYPVSVWRRYDKLARFPKGLLVIGDAVCSFNPAYGQGMTSAGLQAAALQRCLSSSDADADAVSRHYFRAAAKKLAPIWRSNRFVDFSLMPADDWRAIPKRLMYWWINKTFAAAAHDVELTETYFRIVELLDQPTALLRPGRLRRVLTA